MVSCITDKEKVAFECKHHKDYFPLFMQLSNIKDGDILLCSQCTQMSENDDQQLKQLQSIEILIKSQDNTILPKWPPLENQDILRQIQKYLVDGTKNKNSQKEKVTEYFDRIQRELNKHIDDVKKQMLQMCNILPELEESLYSQYNKIAEKTRLKEILMASDTTFDEVNLKLKQIIQQKEDQKQQNEESLTGIFSSYKANIKQFDENAPISIMNQIVQLIDSINFFPKTDQIRHINSISICLDGLTEKEQVHLEKLVKNFNNKEKNIDITTEVSQVITDLICNPANCLTKEFQEYITLKMKDLTLFINEFDLKNIHEKDQTPIDFSKLNNEQVGLIKQLIEKMSNLKKINDNKIDYLSLPKTYQFVELLNKENQYYPQIFKLIQQYPIYEFIEPMKLNFLKSNYKLSQAIEIQNLPNQEIKFSKRDADGWVIILSDLYLEKNKRYEIVFEINFQNENNFAFAVGLTSNGDKSDIFDDPLSFFEEERGIDCTYGIGQIKKGTVNTLKKKKQLQLSVCLSKGILEVGDYPSLDNIMELDDNKKNRLEGDTLYKIGFYIFCKDDELIIKSISETLI